MSSANRSMPPANIPLKCGVAREFPRPSPSESLQTSPRLTVRIPITICPRSSAVLPVHQDFSRRLVWMAFKRFGWKVGGGNRTNARTISYTSSIAKPSTPPEAFLQKSTRGFPPGGRGSRGEVRSPPLETRMEVESSIGCRTDPPLGCPLPTSSITPRKTADKSVLEASAPRESPELPRMALPDGKAGFLLPGCSQVSQKPDASSADFR